MYVYAIKQNDVNKTYAPNDSIFAKKIEQLDRKHT